MTETTFQRMRQMVCRDAGIPLEAAEGFLGESPDVCAGEALTWVRQRRGDAGVKAALKGFAEADARESPDQIRERIGWGLGLDPELRARLSSAATSEAAIIEDALNLVRETRGPAGLDAAVVKVQSMQMSGVMRDLARPNSTTLVDTDDMNSTIRAMAGRTPDAA